MRCSWSEGGHDELTTARMVSTSRAERVPVVDFVVIARAMSLPDSPMLLRSVRCIHCTVIEGRWSPMRFEVFSGKLSISRCFL